ncbi:hypothetical protein NDU88_004214, partial [Pleurodeles waltl]
LTERRAASWDRIRRLKDCLRVFRRESTVNATWCSCGKNEDIQYLYPELVPPI